MSAATDSLEDVIRYFFARALSRDDVGRDDNFFELGGYSLLIFQLVGCLEELFGLEVPLKVLFEAPTPAEFTQLLRTQLVVNNVAVDEILAKWDAAHPKG